MYNRNSTGPNTEPWGIPVDVEVILLFNLLNTQILPTVFTK